MKITDIKRHPSYMAVTWSDGHEDCFHYVWLRDHLPDKSFFDPGTGERLIDAHNYLSQTEPENIAITTEGELEITWTGLGNPTLYTAKWLRANSYSDENRRNRERFIPEAKPWPFTDQTTIPRFSFADVVEKPRSEFNLLSTFRTYGFAYIVDAPTAPGVVETLTKRLGYLREVAFGAVREIRSLPSYDNVAFTSRDVPPHIDATNYAFPYDVQFLHCIENSAEGGNSAIADGFAVAAALRAENQDAYDILSRVAVSYRIGAAGHDIRHRGPVLEHDAEGGLRLVRFSNQQRRVLSAPFDQVEAFYDAYARFSRLLGDPNNQITFRFQPGDVLMFNNHRVLHARTAFKPATGGRYLQLGTTDMDMVDSRLRILARQLTNHDDIASVLPLEPNVIAL